MAAHHLDHIRRASFGKGQTTSGECPSSIAHHRYKFETYPTYGLVVLDISNPTTPTLLSTISLPTNILATRVKVGPSPNALTAYVTREGAQGGSSHTT